MAQKTIWHAVFEWFEDGVRHWAYRGETVEVPDEVVEQYAKFGVFDSPYDSTPAVAVEPGGDDDADEVRAPAKAATKELWVEYAVSRGLDRDEADALSKQELIKAIG